MDAFSGVVLTGGRSRRMGADKAFVAVDGRTMAVRVAAAIRAAGAAEVLAIGGDTARLRALGVDGRPDPRQGEGPLGGILTAFDVVTHDTTFVAATDLAWLDSATVAALVNAVGVADVAAADAGRLEPLCAAWRTSRCAPILRECYAAGERAVHRAMEHLAVVRVAVDGHAVRNANTPGDLRC